MEARLCVRLLARTTRSVAPTAAGDRLLATLTPALSAIDRDLAAISAAGERPAGRIRLTIVRHGYAAILQSRVADFLNAHPTIELDIALDDGLTDIVAKGFDAGIRLGGLVDKDMIGVRIGADVEPAVVAAPIYLAGRSVPRTPRDLHDHRCINYRLARADGLYAWQFERGGERISVRVDGPLTLNDGDAIRQAACDGVGIGYLWLDQVAADLGSGRLVRLLADWCPPTTGYHLYHPSRRQTPPTLKALIDWLRKSAP